ncbi:hypothetical protein [Streptococcus suis]|uniref:hypothetical protein n=1 Tax=Streptococcus suis TaxID=1307 RepID=UPI0023D8A999|nr:hypothetical protein M8286_05025 [Streptococcus suis]
MEVMMKTKILSLHNLIGFVTTPPGNLTLVDLLEQVYEMGNAFKVSLLDLAYTDGPVIFKSSLRSTEDLVIFTSIVAINESATNFVKDTNKAIDKKIEDVKEKLSDVGKAVLLVASWV